MGVPHTPIGIRKSPSVGIPVDQPVDLAAYRDALDLWAIQRAVKGRASLPETYQDCVELDRLAGGRTGDAGDAEEGRIHPEETV